MMMDIKLEFCLKILKIFIEIPILHWQRYDLKNCMKAKDTNEEVKVYDLKISEFIF